MSLLARSHLSPLLLNKSFSYHPHMTEISLAELRTLRFPCFWKWFIREQGEQNTVNRVNTMLFINWNFWSCHSSTLKTTQKWSLQVAANLESRQGKKKIGIWVICTKPNREKMPHHCQMNIVSKVQSHSVLLRLTLSAECCEIYFSGLWPPYISIRPLSI